MNFEVSLTLTSVKQEARKVWSKFLNKQFKQRDGEDYQTEPGTVANVEGEVFDVIGDALALGVSGYESE